MSYCRFGYHSDVYCYESCYGGWQVHVATNRHISDHPFPEMPERWSKEDAEAVMTAYRAQVEWYKTASLEPIAINPPGEDANLETPGEAASYLEHLRSMGYTVPQGAIDALREEAINPEPAAD